MSFSIWKRRFLNNYKKYVAISLSTLGVAFLLASFIVNAIGLADSSSSFGLSSLTSIINFLLLALAYGYLFYGNLNGTSIAYRGMLLFVFYVLWDFGYASFSMLLNLISVASTQDPLYITISIALFVGTILALASGILCYVRTRQYLTSTYAKYEMVRLWALLFMIFVLLGDGLMVAYYASFVYLGVAPLYVFFYLLEPISIMLMSIVCFFTVLRLKSNY